MSNQVIIQPTRLTTVAQVVHPPSQEEITRSEQIQAKAPPYQRFKPAIYAATGVILVVFVLLLITKLRRRRA